MSNYTAADTALPTEAPSDPIPSSAPRRAGSKYTGIIISVVLFVLLDLGVLGLNYATSYRLAADAVSINLAARQRMLSQRMSKALLQLDNAARAGQSIEPARKELQLTHDLFDTTLLALGQSGTVTGGDGKPVFVPAVESAAGQELVRKAQAVWGPFKEVLQPVLAARERLDADILAPAISYMSARNLEILSLANLLATELVNNDNSHAFFLRAVQAVAMVLVLLNFALTIFHFFGKLRRSDAEIEAANRGLLETNDALAATTNQLAEAKQESDLILSTVRQGMLLASRDGTIGEQHSAELTEIFRTDQLAGYNFLHLLQRIMSEKLYVTTRDYFDMLFDPSKKEKLLNKINPLARVEVNFNRPEGGFITKHLEFTFRRIRAAEGEEIARVFVAVRDITQQVELEERLKQVEQKKEHQFELLLGILHVGAVPLKEFVALVESELHQINQTLKAEDFIAAAGGSRQTAALRGRLDQVFRSVHNIKGNADFLKLDQFSKAAHAFEGTITDLKNRTRLAGDDFLSVTIHQSDLRNDLAEVRDLADKLVGLRHGLAAASAPEAKSGEAVASAPIPTGTAAALDDLFAGVRSLADTLGARLGKEVDVRTSELNGSMPPVAFHGIMRDVLIQLTRNALVHGVEPSAEREAQGKAPRATLYIGPADCYPGDATFGFVFRDDGRGLDPARIRRRAVERGLISARDAAALGDAEAALLIFESGFSTAEEVTGDAGRGVGLNLVRERIVNELGGEILIESARGQFCEFIFLLPRFEPSEQPPVASRELTTHGV